MNNLLKIISIVLVVLTLLSSCSSQNNQNFGENFDQLKASKTRVSLGLTYLKNGNFSQAKYNLDKALEFAPRSADANFAMAYYYQTVSELEQAEKAYQFAMDLEPKNANIANSYGAFLCQNGDYEKAKTYFLKAVNTSNYVSSAETYENLAMCSQNQGRPEDSIQYLRSAVNHQPGRASSLYLLAQSLVETQQWQEAREILRRYEKVSQISPQSLLLAMKIESGTGNEATAKGYLDMLLKIFPNDPITRSAYAEQKRSSELSKKKDDLAVLLRKAKSAPVLIESQTTQLPAEKVAIEPESNDLLIIVEAEPLVDLKEAKVSVEKAAKEVVAVVESNQEQPLELVENTEAPSSLIEKAKVDSELAESNATQLPVDKTVTQLENSGVNKDNIVMQEDRKGSLALEDSEQKPYVELVEKSELTESPIEKVKDVPELVESQKNRMPSDNAVSEAEVDDSLENTQEASIVAKDVLTEVEAGVEKSSEPVSEIEPVILEKPVFHVVAKGENLYRISLLYNIKMQRLIDWNGLVDESAIYEGKKLSLVAPSVVE